MDYRATPTVIFLGNERYPKQPAQKICIDYGKRTIRMSLFVSDDLRKLTTRSNALTSPKREKEVIHISLDSDLIRFDYTAA